MTSRTREIDDPFGASGQGNLEALFKRYYRPLVVFANTYVHHLEEAEDIVQEQFVKLWGNGNLEHIPEGALSTYFFTVVKNACINFLDKKKLPLSSLNFSHYQIACKEAEMLDDEVVNVITTALQGLPEKTRQVVECVILNERSYKDAAVELSVSTNTIKTLLRLGMKTLRDTLQDQRTLLLFFHLFIHPFFKKSCFTANTQNKQ
jgi:RNA polymerase sigma-70 factor (ECF subfamily)